MSLHSSTLTFQPYPKLSELNPGIKPYEFSILVLVREVARKTAGGIVIPEGAVDREEEAGDEGLLVAVSPLAFNETDFPDANAVPKVGEVVLFARYAGKTYVGADGRKYRIMKDKDVTGGRVTAKASVKAA